MMCEHLLPEGEIVGRYIYFKAHDKIRNTHNSSVVALYLIISNISVLVNITMRRQKSRSPFPRVCSTNAYNILHFSEIQGNIFKNTKSCQMRGVSAIHFARIQLWISAQIRYNILFPSFDKRVTPYLYTKFINCMNLMLKQKQQPLHHHKKDFLLLPQCYN